jgi:hypothetical protein
VRPLVLGCLAALAACASAPPALPGSGTPDRAGPAVTERHYTLWWNGARIGSAVEAAHGAGGALTRLERRERLLVRRGDALAAIDLRLAIDVDPGLVARAVTVETRDGGAVVRSGAARGRDGRWRIDVAGEPSRTAAGAVPAELVPYLVHRDGGFAGPVLLAGRGFAIADGEVVRDGARYRAVLRTPAGDLTSTLVLDRDGAALSIAGGDGVVQRRASASEAGAPFAPPEAITAGAIALDRVAPDDGPVALALAPVDRAPPPPLPGQAITTHNGGWHVVLDRSRAAPGAALGPVADLVTAVARDVVDDLGAPLLAADTTRGDCTAHAVAFVRRAGAAGIAARVVTGYRVDGDRLVRHRWALARVADVWIAVDPTFGEAPAAPRLIGLAVHGDSAAELALADAAYTGLAAATASLSP